MSRPILDDLAQIIGPGVRCAAYALPSTRKIVRVTLKALRGRNAALLANHGAVCIGRDLEEAYTCCQILEKGCKAFIEAEFLGGARPINRLEAAFMHQYYLRKYAKKEREDSMSDQLLVLAYDIGTTSAKTCLFELGAPSSWSGASRSRIPCASSPVARNSPSTARSRTPTTGGTP